jgi:hypothetical protein
VLQDASSYAANEPLLSCDCCLMYCTAMSLLPIYINRVAGEPVTTPIVCHH